jgi:hypothetical protein
LNDELVISEIDLGGPDVKFVEKSISCPEIIAEDVDEKVLAKWRILTFFTRRVG